MKVIYKYRLPFKEKSEITMPVNSTIIRVDGIDGAIWVWAIVDPELPLITRHFELYKTGGEMPDDINGYLYHGCGAIHIQMELMMYVFEKPGSETEASEQSKVNWKDYQDE